MQPPPDTHTEAAAGTPLLRKSPAPSLAVIHAAQIPAQPEDPLIPGQQPVPVRGSRFPVDVRFDESLLQVLSTPQLIYPQEGDPPVLMKRGQFPAGDASHGDLVGLPDQVDLAPCPAAQAIVPDSQPGRSTGVKQCQDTSSRPGSASQTPSIGPTMSPST